ncbi:Swarming motility regulation sensor protein RssA [compost metagenome]
MAPVAASGNALYELLANIVHNAILYTPAGGRISVVVQVQAEQVRVLVQDSGPGIAAADRERAFARFERLPSSAAGVQTTGSGLGLAIARTYARRMHGDVLLADGEGGRGLGVCVLLPLALPAMDKLS